MSERGLRPALSLFDISTLSSASMGPAYSLAATMGPMIAAAGSAAPLALVAIACCMGCIASAYGLLSARFPHAGSAYGWAQQAFGRYAGVYTAWILLVATCFATLATSIPAGTYTLALFAPKLVDSPIAVAIVSTVWVIASGVLLGMGVRPTAGVTAALLILEVVVLAASGLAAALLPVVPHATAVPLPSPAFGGFVTALVLAIWMVDGWELSASTSEEARDRTGAASGGTIALVVVAVLTLGCMVAYMRFLGGAAFLGRETDAMSLVGERLGGAWRPLIIFTVLVSTSSALWTTILILTRTLYAMGRDTLLSARFTELDVRGAPRFSLVVITIVASICTLLAGAIPSVSAALSLVLSGSGIFLGLLFVISAAAAIKLLRREFPVRAGALAVVGIAGILFAIAAQVAAPSHTALRLSALAGVVLGIPFAWWGGAKSEAKRRSV